MFCPQMPPSPPHSQGTTAVALILFQSLHPEMVTELKAASLLWSLSQGAQLGSSHGSKKSHCFHRMNSSKVRRTVAPTRARVFISGVMKLAKVETNTRSTAISARMTLMSLPSRARALAFSTPSNWTTCCCCCCSSSLVMRVRHDSTAS